VSTSPGLIILYAQLNRNGAKQSLSPQLAEEKHKGFARNPATGWGGSLVIRQGRISIEPQLSIDHNCDVAALLQKLHNPLSLLCQLRPTRTGLGILFETAQFIALKLKIHFAQARSTRAPDWETAVP
jgi:hypothetical protein